MITEEKIENPDQDEQALPADDTTSEATFAEMLDDYEPEHFKKGQFVEGQILQIDGNTILADVDGKRTAIVPPQDLARITEDELAKFSVGDEVTLFVMHTPVGDDDLLVSLNKGLEQKEWQEAKGYLNDEELLELEVIGHNRGGLLVAFGSLRGFVPASHVPQLWHIRDQNALASQKAKMVGEELLLTVIEVDRDRSRLVLSGKKAQKEYRQKRLEELKQMEGETISGRVTNLVKFGAFVDLDGMEGLIHISEIAWQNVKRPGNHLTLGEEVEVLIQSVDVEKERISLSRKALLSSPWDSFANSHAIGDLLEGNVTNVTDFGAFVRVAEGIEGLIHVSEMHGTRDAAARDVLSSGDTVLVRILDVQPERERLGLSQRQVDQEEEMEWIWRRQQAAAEAFVEEEE